MSSEMHEMMRKFHNQKDGDFDSSNGVVHSGREKHSQHRRIEQETTETKRSEFEDIISTTVLILKNIDLKSEARDDSEQIELLNKKKEIALRKISSLFADINSYTLSIGALDSVKMQREFLDQKDYLAQFDRADAYRKQLHNSLMRNMQSTIQYIQYNFGKINDKALEKWEEKQEDQGIEILDVQRMTFPPKVVCPENIDLNDRKQITSWAVRLALSLGKLKKDLS